MLFGMLLLINLLCMAVIAMSYQADAFKVQTISVAPQLHSYQSKSNALELFIEHYYLPLNAIKKKCVLDLKTITVLFYLLSSTFVLLFKIPMPVKLFVECSILLLPWVLLELESNRIEHAIDTEILTFLQYLNTSLQQSEDVLKGLKYSEKMTQNKHLKKLLGEFNSSIRAGLDERVAFRTLLRHTNHDYLKYIVLNMEQVYSRRGHMIKLINSLELEFTAIQVEVNKRKIELIQERKMALFSVGIVLLTSYKVFTANDYIMAYYLTTELGKFLFVLMSFAFLFAIVIIIRAGSIKY